MRAQYDIVLYMHYVHVCAGQEKHLGVGYLSVSLCGINKHCQVSILCACTLYDIIIVTIDIIQETYNINFIMRTYYIAVCLLIVWNTNWTLCVTVHVSVNSGFCI